MVNLPCEVLNSIPNHQFPPSPWGVAATAPRVNSFRSRGPAGLTARSAAAMPGPRSPRVGFLSTMFYVRTKYSLHPAFCLSRIFAIIRVQHRDDGDGTTGIAFGPLTFDEGLFYCSPVLVLAFSVVLRRRHTLDARGAVQEAEKLDRTPQGSRPSDTRVGSVPFVATRLADRNRGNRLWHCGRPGWQRCVAGSWPFFRDLRRKSASFDPFAISFFHVLRLRSYWSSALDVLACRNVETESRTDERATRLWVGIGREPAFMSVVPEDLHQGLQAELGVGMD